ncbi:hypothetical protein FACS189476_06090 [Spirochaetia bacterium]|nr:hypothetical protein FACS189476_06090 [Spirochaetia bacterium]
MNGAALKIKGSGLTAGVYRAHLQVQDSKGKVFNKTVEFRVSVPSQMINMIAVPGGAYQIKESDSPSPQLVTKTVTGFKMAETETTQELWTAVMGYNPSIYINNSLGPVDHLNWYDAITFCNRLSIAMGKTPVYAIDGIDFRTITYEQIPTELSTASIIDLWNSVTINSAADGYRLPGKYEWFWASMGADSDNPGAVNETGYLKAYAGASGTNSAGINDYAWPNITTHPVRLLLPNELGFFDMTGNAAEWFWDLIDQYASQNHYLSGFTGMYITYTSATDGRFRTNGMNGIRLACNL